MDEWEEELFYPLVAEAQPEQRFSHVSPPPICDQIVLLVLITCNVIFVSFSTGCCSLDIRQDRHPVREAPVDPLGLGDLPKL